MPSVIKSKKPIKFGKLFVIRRIGADEETIKRYSENIRSQNKNISEKDFSNALDALIKRDNYYNTLMEEVSKAYEFELDEKEIEDGINMFMESNPNISREELKDRLTISVYKKLIYEDLEKDWEITIPDDMVRNALESFYQETGHPIREYLLNPKKFEEVRNTLKEEVISDRLINAFAVEWRLEN